MKEFDSLKEIWNRQETPDLPEVSAIVAKAAKIRNTTVRKIIFQVATMMIAMVAVIWVVATIDFKMPTTYVGVAIMLATVFGFAGIRIYQIVRLNGIDLSAEPSKVLADTEELYKFQCLVNTKGIIAYFILLNTGFGLYFIEVMKPMSVLAIAIFLSAYVAWMLIAYFILGKRQVAKEHKRTESIIDTIRKIEQDYTRE
ncbi:MAG TPA: hypothetical protein VF676_02125 [Flavobacterium sp.]|jgi:hypothetical protein